MLRLKVGTVYLLLWLILVGWMTRNLPEPVHAAKFFADSKAHWFMNAGLAILFVVILYQLGRKPEQDANVN